MSGREEGRTRKTEEGHVRREGSKIVTNCLFLILFARALDSECSWCDLEIILLFFL